MERGRTKGLVGGSDREFERIYRETAPFVLRALRRLVPSESLEDAAQDVFLTVLRRLPDFEGRARFSTWVYGIVLRVASDHRRAERRRLRRVDALRVEPTCEPVSPEREVEVRQGARLIERALLAMRRELREVFVLVELDELSGPEAARLLDLNPNTMHSRLRVARSEFEALAGGFGAGSAWGPKWSV